MMFHHFHDSFLHKQGQGSISSNKFEKIIAFMQENFNLLNADEFINKLIDKKLEKIDTVITLDDALKSQIDIALPIMDSLNIKAFFFVYKEAFGESPVSLEFYRDFRNNYYNKIEYFYKDFFDSVKKIYPKKYIKYQEDYNEEYLKKFPFYSDQDKRFRFLRDKILFEKDYFSVMDSMLLNKNYNKANEKKRLLMNISDLKILEKSNHIIGLHSSSHPTFIDKLNPVEQYNEYKENKDFLEKNISQEIISMSHPCGRYNQETLNILKELKIKVGFRSSMFPNYINTNLEVPREDHTNIIKKFNL